MMNVTSHDLRGAAKRNLPMREVWGVDLSVALSPRRSPHARAVSPPPTAPTPGGPRGAPLPRAARDARAVSIMPKECVDYSGHRRHDVMSLPSTDYRVPN